MSSMRSPRPGWASIGTVAAIGGLTLAGATAAPGASVALPQDPPPTERQLSRAHRAFVDQTVADLMARYRLPGLSLAMSGPKGRYVQTYGVADRRTGRALRLRDHVRIASITKSFVATAVLQQIERGALSFRDTLSEWVRGIPHGRRITIRQLLAMRSGIYDFTSDPDFNRRFEADPLMRFQPRDIIPIIQRHEPLFEPGTRTSYADSNYILLGIILRKVTGRPVAEVITEDVIEPAGLGATSVPTTPAMPRPFARGYFAGADGAGPIRDFTKVNPLVPWTAGNMISTLPNLRRWGRVLAAGTLLSAHLQEQRLRMGRLPNPGGARLGYGLGIMGIGKWVGHDGAIFGYSTVTVVNPNTGAQFAATANLSSNFSTPTAELFIRVATDIYPKSLR